MKRALLLAVVVLALGASEAGAHTTIIGAGAPGYQAWADEAKVPTPSAIVNIVQVAPGACRTEYGYEPIACVDPVAATIFAPYPLGRHVFEHELGHIVDTEAMTDQLRGRFAALIRWPASPWLSAAIHDTAGEFFADVYAECFRGLPHSTYLLLPGEVIVAHRRIRAACRLIAAL